MDDGVKLARGQVWYLKFNDSVGSEEAVGRPAVIISSERGLETSSVINMVYLTTSPKRGGYAVELSSLRKRSWALCNQIVSVDKERLLTQNGTVTESELLKIELSLRTILALPVKEDQNVLDYKTEIDQLKSNISGLEVELAVHKRLYEKALEKLIDLKFEKDCRVVEPEPEVVLPEPKVVVREPEPEPVEELDLSGLKEKFKVYDERLKNNKKPKPEREKPEPKKEKVKCCGNTPIKQDWVVANINTDSAQEIHDKTGLGLITAKDIIAYRKKHGAYKDVSDLLNLSRFGSRSFEVYCERLEV